MAGGSARARLGETLRMAELFRFRCYQCQKLIGAPPSRFGSVVKCPRCGVELIVPSPDELPTPDENPDLNAFRPEDLGLRIELEPLLQPQAPAPTASETVVGPDPIAFLNQVAETGEYPTPEIRQELPTGSLDASEPSVEPSELISPREEPLIPRKRGRRPSAPGEPTIRARDVVLPRTAAVAWALFAILALAFAFTSGLFVGHTLWK